MGSGHSEYLKYITQSINASAPRGITAAQVWCAQTAEAVGLCTGNELETLMLEQVDTAPEIQTGIPFSTNQASPQGRNVASLPAQPCASCVGT